MRVLLLFFFLFFLNCSTPKEKGTLYWVISTKELHTTSLMESITDPCKLNCVELNFKLINTSDKNFLLYNFNRFFEFAEFNDKVFCDTIFLSAVRYVYIYDKNGEQVKPLGRMPDSINWKPMSVLERQMTKSKIWFRNSIQIVKKGETLNFKQQVNLRDFNFVFPGTYKLKLLYYQQDVLREITQQELEEDIRLNDAVLFKGCLLSNDVDLVVK